MPRSAKCRRVCQMPAHCRFAPEQPAHGEAVELTVAGVGIDRPDLVVRLV